MPLARPETSTGVLLQVVVPLPSWPSSLEPQHLTPPPVVSAQVWLVPAATALTPLARPETSTGTLFSIVMPFPSSPLSLEPQHLPPPSLVSAQVWSAPAAIAVFAGLTASGDDVGDGMVAGGDDVGGGVVAGVGLAADAQAATSSPTTRVVATPESEERIPAPPDGVSGETFGGARCYS